MPTRSYYSWLVTLFPSGFGCNRFQAFRSDVPKVISTIETFKFILPKDLGFSALTIGDICIYGFPNV